MIIPLELGSDSYDIVLERGCMDCAGELLNLNRRALIVTDDSVPSQYAEKIAKQCAKPHICTVKTGEESKSIEIFKSLLIKMLNSGFTRKDCVVAVGGGVVGDLAGFTAASYMRGVDFYNIPTTILSQVDSSIGGKTAVNLDGIKNIVGAFYQPKKVLIDPDVLKTLPQRQISNGLAEAVKMSLTSDEKLFEIFEHENIEDNLETIIERSLKIKRSVVEQDEKENGLRKILNFGHTLGHGIEVTGSLYHGEAVALGMLPMCSKKVRERLIPVLKKLSLPTCCQADPEKIYAAVVHDKKAANGKVSLIKVYDVGSFEIEETPIEELKKYVDYFEK